MCSFQKKEKLHFENKHDIYMRSKNYKESFSNRILLVWTILMCEKQEYMPPYSKACCLVSVNRASKALFPFKSKQIPNHSEIWADLSLGYLRISNVKMLTWGKQKSVGHQMLIGRYKSKHAPTCDDCVREAYPLILSML